MFGEETPMAHGTWSMITNKTRFSSEKSDFRGDSPNGGFLPSFLEFKQVQLGRENKKISMQQ
jgi:hypothetical protein